MFVAARGVPDLQLMILTVIGGTLSAGGANAVNMWYDRDIDAKMHRTSKRPLVKGTVSPASALVFAILLEVMATALFVLFVNPLSAYLSLGAALFYVFVYTMWLKRSSTSNIVIGGAAGAAPALVGWAAVANEVSAASLVMFGIVFLWTPPHFWALAMKYHDDYAAARVPMLPVVRSISYTTMNILIYTVALFAMALALAPVAQLGLIYMVSAAIAGGVFIATAVNLRRRPSDKSAMRVFHWSITYLTIVFVAMAIDQVVGL